MNGLLLEVAEPELVIVTTDLAAGKITEKVFSQWLKENCEPITKKVKT